MYILNIYKRCLNCCLFNAQKKYRTKLFKVTFNMYKSNKDIPPWDTCSKTLLKML